MSCYRFIDRHCHDVPVCELYTVLQEPPRSYYAWLQRRGQPVPTWERAVVWAFARHGRRYGTRHRRAPSSRAKVTA